MIFLTRALQSRLCLGSREALQRLLPVAGSKKDGRWQRAAAGWDWDAAQESRRLGSRGSWPPGSETLSRLCAEVALEWSGRTPRGVQSLVWTAKLGPSGPFGGWLERHCLRERDWSNGPRSSRQLGTPSPRSCLPRPAQAYAPELACSQKKPLALDETNGQFWFYKRPWSGLRGTWSLFGVNLNWAWKMVTPQPFWKRRPGSISGGFGSRQQFVISLTQKIYLRSTYMIFKDNFSSFASHSVFSKISELLKAL